MAILTSQEQRVVDDKLLEISSNQTSWSSLYAKFKQYPLTTIGNVSFEVYEIRKPSTEKVGYFVILYKTVDSVKYARTYGFGLDSTLHTNDWAVYDPIGV